VVTVLLLVNLLARVLLLATAWMSQSTPETPDADTPPPLPQRATSERAPTAEPRAESRGGRP
jgi:hypothetical protein